ncbi:VlhA.5.13 variable lipoprotein family protein [Mycoplasmoides gallisepticum str. R(low)]|uniref:VlhA.5.13 variable lipoprotein family protein n=2 Tax=Mycoplasmoides gallisepticum TaxID=2096 RepID=Q7NBD0_MYCGA|nr:FIVAR domain-containing protein [Mycoplasmoides gallisepticum]AAP56699.1 VlhA.5.13 variable lipoprotein family protein [Mycoplasmoides gallisepticum str. R(low)]ADC30550.1 VlhA.5.13 variable lipoprotein family protein [Mycoplasmoides gallisepticum str. R(high)]
MSKKRIILKTISLLGTTSSLSIGISSCMSITKKDANPNNSQTQLQTARMELTDLINAKAMTLASLQDYAKIEASLSSAYSEAETVNNNLNATLEQLNMAKTNLESAINQANTDKTTFDNEHPNLVEAYKTLKTTLSQRATNLEGLASTAYNQIRNNLVDLYNKASSLITKTLDPLNGGTLLDSNEITTANKNINNTLSTINEQKTNANALANSFIKEVIQNNKQSFVGMFTNTNVQPSNYSFVAFSADVTPVNYKYARRTVWNGDEPSSRILANTNSITDVSWIYSLAGTNTKYQFSFSNYGPSTGYLYFPYKLVKAADASNVGLQYKLNNGNVQQVEFATSTSANNTTANPTPAVDEIKVAKIVLSGLRFGQNTIELSVPTGEGNMNKVAPMIGNIYLSSNENNADKIYNDIFGNTINQQNNATSVMINMVEGYNLASSYSPAYKLINVSAGGGGQTQPYYVIGWLGASDQNARTAMGTNMNVQRVPATTSTQGGYARYLSFYVNAPQAGSYYISGNYNSLTNRGLAVSTDTKFTTNVIKITHLQVIDATNRILTFDTKTKRGTDSNNGNITLEANKDTITLTKGWNKVYVSGNNNDSVGIGNLTFTLMPPQTNS